jgi:hypothetical protein
MHFLVLVWVLAYHATVQVSLCYVFCVSSLYALSIKLINVVNSHFNAFYLITLCINLTITFD